MDTSKLRKWIQDGQLYVYLDSKNKEGRSHHCNSIQEQNKNSSKNKILDSYIFWAAFQYKKPGVQQDT